MLGRIHFTVHFPHLNEASRRQIWKTFITKTPSGCNITEDDIDSLAKETMNGRQVRCIAFFLDVFQYS